MMWYGWNFGSIFGWLWMAFVVIIQILFRGLVIWGIVTLLQNYWKIFKNTKDDEALDILRKKYANGEISKKEFTEKKKDLS